MFRILADTNIWINIVEDPNQFQLLDVLELLVQKGVVQLVVPSTVLHEFHALRDGAAMKCAKSMSSHLQAVRDVVLYEGGDPNTVRLVLEHLQHVDQRSDARVRTAELVLRRIDAQLKAVQAIEPSQDVQLACFLRARKYLAPFHNVSNAINDAIIMETYAECIRTQPPASDQRYLFVSNDYKAFSAASESRKVPHGDYDCFDNVHSCFFNSLDDAIDHMKKSEEVANLLANWTRKRSTVADLARRYNEDFPGNGLFHTLRRFQRVPLGTRVASSLTPKDIVDYCKLRATEKVVASTIRHDIVMLRIMLRHAIDEWHEDVALDALDAANAYIDKLPSREAARAMGRAPTEEECARILNYYKNRKPDPRRKIPMRELIEFSLATGRRISEICALRWDQISTDFHSCQFNADEEEVTLPVDATAVLQRLPKYDIGFVFCKPPGRKQQKAEAVDEHSVSKNFRDVIVKLKIRGVQLDSLRKLTQIRMFDAGDGPNEVSMLTGRKDVTGLAREYREHQEKKKRAALGRKARTVA
jgi:integrase